MLAEQVVHLEEGHRHCNLPPESQRSVDGRERTAEVGAEETEYDVFFMEGVVRLCGENVWGGAFV